jgi:hypothetical protein
MFQTIYQSLTSSLPSTRMVQCTQMRHMSKYLSKSAGKRLPLTPKHVRKGFYKGNGSTKEGKFTGKAGRFVLDKEMMLELVVPDLTGFQLKPYIARTVPKKPPN